MMAAAPAAPSSTAVRSFSYQPAQEWAGRRAPYLRADHKVLGQYGD